MTDATHSGQRIARNTLLNLGGLGLPLLVGVVAVPVVVSGLGVARFGILALVWVMLGYMALLDLGLGRATTKFTAEALATGDHRRIAASARVAATTQLAMGTLAGIALALAVPLLVERALQVPAALVDEARTSFYLMAAVTPALLLNNTFRGLLEAAQRFDLVNAVRLPTSTANFLFPLVGVLLGWGLPLIVAVLMGTRVVSVIAIVALALRQYPRLTHRVVVNREEVLELLGFGGWVTVSSLISPLLVYLDRFAIGAVVSMAAVGFYSAPHEMVMRLTLLPASVVATLFPALAAGAAGVGTELERVRRLVAGGLKFLLLAAGPVLVMLAVLGPQVLTVWLGPEFARESGLALRFLAVGMLVNALAYVPGVLLQATGRPDLPAKFHLLELPVHVVVLWVFVARWGIAGAAGAWALRMALDGALLFGAAARLRLVSWTALRAIRVPQAMGLLLGLALAAIAANVAVAAVVPRLVILAGMLVAVAVAAWTVLLDGQERRELLAAIRPGAAGMPTGA